jgi:hypothetical protein
MTRHLERHPRSADYPDLAGRTWEEFLANVQARGADSREIILYEGKVLDGWQLYRACQELGVKYRTRKLPEGEDPEAFVEQANDLRRHESAERMQRRLDKRRERVAHARTNGQSIRTIAEAEGVSVATVHNDLEAVTVQGRTVTPPSGKTTGKDGRQQPATRDKAKPILCQRCTSIGQETPTTGCTKCQAERAKAKHDAKKSRRKKKVENGAKPTEILDDYKTPVPARCKDAFCDPWIQDTFDLLATVSEKVRMARVMDGMKKRAKHYPFFDSKDFIDGVGFVIQYLDAVMDHIKKNRPSGVCPKCEGKGCGDCRQSGLVPRSVYAKLKEAKK